MMNRKKIISRLVPVITLLILVALGTKALEMKHIMKQLDKQIITTEKALQDNEAKIKELKTERENMNTPEYIEKVAREKLGMVKTDDIVFKQK